MPEEDVFNDSAEPQPEEAGASAALMDGSAPNLDGQDAPPDAADGTPTEGDDDGLLLDEASAPDDAARSWVQKTNATLQKRLAQRQAKDQSELARLRGEAEAAQRDAASFRTLLQHPNGAEILKQYQTGLQRGDSGAGQLGPTPFQFKIEDDAFSPQAKEPLERVLNGAFGSFEKRLAERLAAAERSIDERLSRQESHVRNTEWGDMQKRFGKDVETVRGEAEKLHAAGLSWSKAVYAASDGKAAQWEAKARGTNGGSQKSPSLPGLTPTSRTNAAPTNGYRRGMGIGDLLKYQPR